MGLVTSDELDERLGERKLELVHKEWGHLNSLIISYDRLIFNIRGWAISVFAALTSLSVGFDNEWFVSVLLLPILMFWLLDALHKSFQHRYISRIREIERFLQKPDFFQRLCAKSSEEFIVPNTSALFSAGGGGALISREVLGFFLLRNVALTYAPMLVLAIGILCFRLVF